MSTCQVLFSFIAWQSYVVESLWFSRVTVKDKSTWGGLPSQHSATPVELFDVGDQMSPSFSWCILLDLSANSNYCFLNFIRWFIFRVPLRTCVQLELWTRSNLHLKKLVCDSRCWRHLTYLLEDEQLGGERRRFEMGATHGHGSLQTLTTILFPCNGR